MTSLITEYRKRHGLNCVLSMDEGVTFFDAGKRPAAIVMTSSHSRSVTNCRQCLSHEGGLIGELFVHTGQSYPHPTFKMVRHEHIEADIDLRAWANRYAGEKEALEPYIAPSDRDVECWLWRFFVRNNQSFARKWQNKDEPFRSLEQIAWAIDNSGTHQSQPRVFEAFYKTLYYTFRLGRKYTIYG